MEHEQQVFFNAGLRYYQQALQATAEFKEQLVQELQQAMQRQTPDSSLQLASDPKFSSTVGAVRSPYVSVLGAIAQPGAQEGAGAAAPRLELGLWWSPPFRPRVALAAYAGVFGVPWSKRINRPRGFKGDSYKGAASTYLTLAVEDAASLSAALDDLLKHLDIAAREHQRPPR